MPRPIKIARAIESPRLAKYANSLIQRRVSLFIQREPFPDYRIKGHIKN
jgi:hypothetical protein